MSSTLYGYVNAGKKLLNKKKFKFNSRERIRQCIWKVKFRAIRYSKLFSCNKLRCSCKNEARVAYYCNYKLSRDRKNPGPLTYVDPNKTIVASYIVKVTSQFLDRMQDNNVLQWVYVLWFTMTHKGSALQMFLYK